MRKQNLQYRVSHPDQLLFHYDIKLSVPPFTLFKVEVALEFEVCSSPNSCTNLNTLTILLEENRLFPTSQGLSINTSSVPSFSYLSTHRYRKDSLSPNFTGTLSLKPIFDDSIRRGELLSTDIIRQVFFRIYFYHGYVTYTVTNAQFVC